MAFFAVLFPALTPQSIASWQCEGRVCGVTAGVCCCISPQDRKDSQCAPFLPEVKEHRSSAVHFQEVGNCAKPCHCTMVSGSQKHLATPVYPLGSPSVPLLAVIPANVSLEAPAAAESLGFVESRGPPLFSASLSHPSLRAPPLA